MCSLSTVFNWNRKTIPSLSKLKCIAIKILNCIFWKRSYFDYMYICVNPLYYIQYIHTCMFYLRKTKNKHVQPLRFSCLLFGPNTVILHWSFVNFCFQNSNEIFIMKQRFSRSAPFRSIGIAMSRCHALLEIRY